MVHSWTPEPDPGLIGIMSIASQEAFAAGVVADPLTELEFPARGWLWRAQYVVVQEAIGTLRHAVICADR